uniref:Bifunctional inhibitor/plant lipid transfer protein/seed storage helical domain-containing protein n=1 Tax=Nelumbo nucifera TaxID=4432 RepID=A0A822YX81_NELNU|nr:TPA_asm: hypothetical protein HUJ06_006006 [Nelumbo nucifera]
MEKSPFPLACILSFSLVLIVLLACGSNNGAIAQPLCLHQIALANRACSIFPVQQPAKLSGNKIHHHHGHHQRNGPSQYSLCCHTLTSMDASCICGMLSRLPIFITNTNHTIILKPDNDCEVSYGCHGN